MTTRRETRAQKVKREKAELRQRLSDIYSGVYGDKWSDDDCVVCGGELSRIVPACKSIFSDGSNNFLFEARSLGEYDSVESLTEFFYRQGVRA